MALMPSPLREIYQELVETNTTNSTGSCTVAANKMARRLKAAGYAMPTCRSSCRRAARPRATWSRA
jgi:hypothetical protein